jgi:hypothetical protein
MGEGVIRNCSFNEAPQDNYAGHVPALAINRFRRIELITF